MKELIHKSNEYIQIVVISPSWNGPGSQTGPGSGQIACLVPGSPGRSAVSRRRPPSTRRPRPGPRRGAGPALSVSEGRAPGRPEARPCPPVGDAWIVDGRSRRIDARSTLAALHRQLRREAPMLCPRLAELRPLRGDRVPQAGQGCRLKLSGPGGPLQPHDPTPATRQWGSTIAPPNSHPIGY